MKRIAVILSLCFLAAVPILAQDVWLGTGHLWYPAQGNYAASAWDTQWQLQAGVDWRTGKHLSFTLAYAQDTLKIESWAESHNFTQLPPSGLKYGLWDAGAGVPWDAGKWTITPEAGFSILHYAGHDTGGLYAGLSVAYNFTSHWYAGAEMKYRHLPNVSGVGVANIAETALRIGYRF
jgi:hypothetical protein